MDADYLNHLLEDSEEIVFLPTFEARTHDLLKGAWTAAAAHAGDAYIAWRQNRTSHTYGAYVAAADQADAAQDALARRHLASAAGL
jgi:hypothetical protein